nr:vanillin dehydrogenase [Quercus suber]
MTSNTSVGMLQVIPTQSYNYTTLTTDMQNQAEPRPVPFWINGEEVYSETMFTVQSPTTNQRLWSASSISKEQCVRAVDAAQTAFKMWRHVKPATVQAICLRAADLFDEHTGDLIETMRKETGALEDWALLNVQSAASLIRDVAGRPAAMMGAIPPTTLAKQAALVLKEPLGVNLAIAPWNAPYILGVRAFLFAIATGNTVVLKGSELCPKTFHAIGSMFHQAGLPPGVLNVIFHQPADASIMTNTLIEHPAVKKVNFTGSTGVGSIIAAKAGKELKPVLMELGGKASSIVCEDADIDKAAFQCALGALYNAGQICMSTERILAHKSIVAPFTLALNQAIETLYPTSAIAPVLVSQAGVAKNRNLVSDAVAKGARVAFGEPDSFEHSDHRLRPIVIADVKPGMDIYHTESFGPTVSLISVESDEEAIEIANDTAFGLSGAVFTESLGRGLKIAKAIDTGAVHINSMSVHLRAQKFQWSRIWVRFRPSGKYFGFLRAGKTTACKNKQAPVHSTTTASCSDQRIYPLHSSSINGAPVSRNIPYLRQTAATPSPAAAPHIRVLALAAVATTTPPRPSHVGASVTITASTSSGIASGAKITRSDLVSAIVGNVEIMLLCFLAAVVVVGSGSGVDGQHHTNEAPGFLRPTTGGGLIATFERGLGPVRVELIHQGGHGRMVKLF